MPTARKPGDAVLKELRAFGLTYPGSHTKSPWPGHLDLAVNEKIFAHLSVEGEPFSISCKLPQSAAAALLLPFTEPTGYGLGKSGWVSARFPDGQLPPTELLKAWIDESYRAVAPRKLVASLDGGAAAPTAAKAKSRAKTGAKTIPRAPRAATKKPSRPRAKR